MKFNDSVYNFLKFLALILLPAAGTFYFALASTWHLPHPNEVVGTIVSLDTFLGALLGLSTSAYNKSEDRFDGVFVHEITEDGSELRLKSVDPTSIDATTGKSELLFKVNKM